MANARMRFAAWLAVAITTLGATTAGRTDEAPARHPAAAVRIIRRSAAGARVVAPSVELPQVQTLIADSDLKEATVPAGTTEAHFAFQVVNVSSGEVTITGVQTSCGCTVAQLPMLPWRLSAGAGGPIAVTMNLVGRSGIVAKTVVVQTDRGVKTLMVRARIEAPAARPPASAITGSRH